MPAKSDLSFPAWNGRYEADSRKRTRSISKGKFKRRRRPSRRQQPRPSRRSPRRHFHRILNADDFHPLLKHTIEFPSEEFALALDLAREGKRHCLNGSSRSSGLLGLPSAETRARAQSGLDRWSQGTLGAERMVLFSFPPCPLGLRDGLIRGWKSSAHLILGS